MSGSGSCPECDIPLRRTNFRLQLFEDAIIDKEVDIRRRILKAGSRIRIWKFVFRDPEILVPIQTLLCNGFGALPWTLPYSMYTRTYFYIADLAILPLIVMTLSGTGRYGCKPEINRIRPVPQQCRKWTRSGTAF